MSRRRMRLLRSFAVLTAAAFAASACGESINQSGDVRAAIDEARSAPYRFTYTVTDPEGTSEVKGVVVDDFRYKALLQLDGEPAFEEIAVDDALAVRVHDSSYLPDFVDEDLRGKVDDETDVDGIDVLSGLAAKRWVLDPVGAPSQTSPDRALSTLGTDPVFDAFSVFQYVERSINESQNQVEDWSEEEINPVYRRTEDLFAPPEEGSGVVRYDLRRPRRPSAADLTSGTRSSLPSTRHFRKMAIYVKDGRLVRVEERVEVVGSAYKDFLDYLREIGDTFGGTEEDFERAFGDLPSRLPESMPIQEQVRWSNEVLGRFNELLEIGGGDPIRIRHMVLDLQDFDDPSISVELPDGEDVLTGSLAVLRSRGLEPVDPDATGT